jgi:signal transduction histidine kinase
VRVEASPPLAVSGQQAAASLRAAVRIGSYVVALAVAYYLAARLGLGFRLHNSQIGVVWPANAVLVAALILTLKSRWWLVLAVTSLAHVFAMNALIPGWRVAWQIVGNSLFATVTVEVLRRFTSFPLRLDSRRQVLAYTATSFVMPALFGFTTPAFFRSLLRFDPDYSPAVALLSTTLSNATALLLVTPVALLWAEGGIRRLGELPTRRIYEAALVTVSLAAAGLVAFGTGPEIARIPSLLLLIFPPLLWAAIRFGPIGASTSLFFVAALSMWGSARQLGPFVHLGEVDQVLSLQLFWIILCPTVMLLAAVIREREQVEAALQDQRNHLAHVTRVTTAGELSGALAHELRQPLTSILANAQAATELLKCGTVDLQEVREILEDIAHETNQAGDVIARLRLFLKEGHPQFERIALETVVRDALALSRSTIQLSGVDVHTQIAAGLPRIQGDPVQLLQVVLNLIVNGCEAMTGVPGQDRHLRLEAVLSGPNVEVLVADCGVGLPARAQDRVFEPFFTTKDKGLGLGLAIGRSIATVHGGRLWGENNPQGGATFHLILPTDHAHGGSPTAHRHR